MPAGWWECEWVNETNNIYFILYYTRKTKKDSALDKNKCSIYNNFRRDDQPLICPARACPTPWPTLPHTKEWVWSSSANRHCYYVD